MNRLEIIDHTENGDGRTVIVSPTDGKHIEYLIQDEGRTLKVFINDPIKEE